MSDLIDRQALLDECLNHYEVGNIEQNCTMDWICKTVRNFPAASPWHRVEEPPKEYGNYLAVVNGEVMEVTYSDISMRDDWNWSTCDAEGFVWIRSEFVTHWMPLPEPPKEES